MPLSIIGVSDEVFVRRDEPGGAPIVDLAITGGIAPYQFSIVGEVSRNSLTINNNGELRADRTIAVADLGSSLVLTIAASDTSADIPSYTQQFATTSLTVRFDNPLPLSLLVSVRQQHFIIPQVRVTGVNLDYLGFTPLVYHLPPGVENPGQDNFTSLRPDSHSGSYHVRAGDIFFTTNQGVWPSVSADPAGNESGDVGSVQLVFKSSNTLQAAFTTGWYSYTLTSRFARVSDGDGLISVNAGRRGTVATLRTFGGAANSPNAASVEFAIFDGTNEVISLSGFSLSIVGRDAFVIANEPLPQTSALTIRTRDVIPGLQRYQLFDPAPGGVPGFGLRGHDFPFDNFLYPPLYFTITADFQHPAASDTQAA